MTIKDMEQLTGITRQNIRFYEREGLITPCRNPENQYREYSMEDVKTLKRIRLYRKLNVPIEDIRNLENRTLSLQSCMEQCISNTEKEMVRMSKIKEVCEELKKQGQEGLEAEVEKTLERIDTFEKSGYQFTDISRDYWNMEVVSEIRGVNRQVAAAMLISAIVAPAIWTVLYYLLSKPEWFLPVPITLISYVAAWLLWGSKNSSVIRKHIRFSPVPASVWIAAAGIGILFYLVTSGSISSVDFFKPVTESLDSTVILLYSKNIIWIWLILIFRNTSYSLIACILFYDICRQKSVITAMGLGALLFALSCYNPYAAAGYIFIGICLAVLYELTDSAAVCMMAMLLESTCSIVLCIVELCFPNTLPELFGTRQSPPIAQLLPWMLLAILLILLLLYSVSRITGKRIDWKQEWDKARNVSSLEMHNATIMDRAAYREIEKKRKQSYRLLDGSLAAGLLLAVWFTFRILL